MTSDTDLHALFRATEHHGERPRGELIIERYDDATDVRLAGNRVQGHRLTHVVPIRRPGEERLLPEDVIDERIRGAVKALARASVDAQRGGRFTGRLGVGAR